MAEVITDISDVTAFSAWIAALPQSDDGDIHVANWTVAGDYEVPTLGILEVEVRVQAADAVAFDFSNPTNSHVAFVSTIGEGINVGDGSLPVTLKGVRVETTVINEDCVATNRFVVKTTNIINCKLIGGEFGFQNRDATDLVHILNTEVTGQWITSFWIKGGTGTVTNATIHEVNLSENGVFGGIYTEVGTVITDTVVYNCYNGDFKGAATYVNCASSDASASGSGAITGVVDADFEDTTNGIYTASVGGVLFESGSGGQNIGVYLGELDLLIITSPVDFKHYGRDISTNTQVVTVEGTYQGSVVPTQIVYTYGGGAETVLDATPVGGVFSGDITLPVGNGDLVVYFSNDNVLKDTAQDVSVGINILVFPSQSNMVGAAFNQQAYTGQAGYFKKYTTDGESWAIGADPFLLASSGSLFPLLANLMVDTYNVPIGFVDAAEGTTTVGDWVLNGTLNNRLVDYFNSSGAGEFEFGLSWIGESDAASGTEEATFKTKFSTLLAQFSTLANVKSYVCGIAAVGAAQDSMRAWLEDLGDTDPNSLGYIDMYSVFQGLHYETDEQTLAAATIIYDTYRTDNSTTLNMTGTGTPDGTYSMKVWSITTNLLVDELNVDFTSGNASIDLPLMVGADVLAFTAGIDAPNTGIAYYGTTV